MACVRRVKQSGVYLHSINIGPLLQKEFHHVLMACVRRVKQSRVYLHSINIGSLLQKEFHHVLMACVPYRSRGPLIFPRIGRGTVGVCPRRRPRRYGTVYLYRALTWSSVVLWSCHHDCSPVSRPTWTYVVLLSCRHSRKAIKPDSVA